MFIDLMPNYLTRMSVLLILLNISGILVSILDLAGVTRMGGVLLAKLREGSVTDSGSQTRS